MNQKDPTTGVLMSIPILIGFIIMFVGEWLLNYLYKGVVPLKMQFLHSSLVFLAWSSALIVVIRRKEFPQIVTVRGPLAIGLGWIFLLLGLFFSILFLYKFISIQFSGG
jgi:hypothetical protein